MPFLDLPAKYSRVIAVLFVACTAAGLVGCPSSAPHPPTAGIQDAEAPQVDELLTRIDAALEYTYENRHLNLQEHAAWQILHGALVYQRDFFITETPGNGELFSAVDHILGGGFMRGWTVRPGTLFEDGRRGLRAELEQGSAAGQGHNDQWLAVLSQCDLPPETEILLGEQAYTMLDFVRQVEWDVPYNTDREYSWTLIALTIYRTTDAQWQAADDETWSIERLVQFEASQAEADLAAGACGGTHRLIGLTMALEQHQLQGGEITGPWLLAKQVIDQSIDTIRAYQNTDGSFSTNWLYRAGNESDQGKRLSTTGHQLEFLSLALSDQELNAPWVRRAAQSMCDVFDGTRSFDLDCGKLYHAAHGLALYRDRLQQPASSPSTPEVEDVSRLSR